MAEPTPQDMTQLLEQIRLGDAAAAQRLFPLVYDELRALAGDFPRAEARLPPRLPCPLDDSAISLSSLSPGVLVRVIPRLV